MGTMILAVFTTFSILHIVTSLNYGNWYAADIVYKPSQSHSPRQYCNGYEMIVQNNPEFIDVCFDGQQKQEQNKPLSEQLMKIAYRHESQVCVRFFDKLDFMDGKGKQLRQQIDTLLSQAANDLYHPEVHPNANPVSSILNVSYSKIEDINIKWTSLNYFAINYCNDSLTTSAENTAHNQLVSIFKKYQQVRRRDYNNNKEIQIEDNARIHKKLHGKGFHQSVTFTLDIPNQWDVTKEHSCSIVYNQVLPHTTYVDFNQLNQPKKGMFVDTFVKQRWGQQVQYIDIEKPAYLSNQEWYSYRIPFSQWSQAKVSSSPKFHTYTYQLPIHFRYATPTNQTDLVQVPMHPFSEVSIVCDYNTVYPVKQDISMYKGVAKIPVGNPNDAKFVSTVTLISEIMCALLLVRQLKKK